MNIDKGKCQRRGRSLRSVSPGTPIAFCKQFHADHCVDDLYIVVNHNGYMDYNNAIKKYQVVVVNMHNGKMSVVDSSRECYKVKGTFTLESRCPSC